MAASQTLPVLPLRVPSLTLQEQKRELALVRPLAPEPAMISRRSLLVLVPLWPQAGWAPAKKLLVPIALSRRVQRERES